MSNIFKKMLGAKAGSDTSSNAAKLITVQQFLGKEQGTTYGDFEFISTYGASLRDTEAQQFEQVFDFMQKGYPIVGALITRSDKSNRPYVMAAFELQKGSNVALKVIVEGKLLQFLKDYQEGTIAINFSVAELIEAAMNDG